MAPITHATVFPFDMTPMNNISAPTYRDGVSYTRTLEQLKVWLNTVLVPEFNAGIDNAFAEFAAGLENMENRIVESETQYNALISDALEYVQTNVNGINAALATAVTNMQAYTDAAITEINEFQGNTAANALGVVRPEAFGALGDWEDTPVALPNYPTQGTGTDDTAAFQAAVDHLLEQGGGTLWLSRQYLINGTVYINQTDYQITKPITIRGPGGMGFRSRGAAIMRETPGDIFCVNLAPVGGSVTFKSLNANVATLTTGTPHGLANGKIVIITGLDDTFNGAYQVTSVPTATSFTYARVAANVQGVAVTEPHATVKISTLPPDETTAGFRAEGFSVMGKRTDPAVVVNGINAFTMWRVRSSFANIYFAYLDYLVHQPSAGTFGANDTYCDQSVYTSLWCQFSTKGGLKLFLPDASTVRDFFYESPMDNAIHALEVRAGQGFKIDGFLAWHPNKPEIVPAAGSSIIDLQTCRAVQVQNLHIERSQQFESVFRLRNVEGFELSSMSSYWHTRTIFRLETAKMVKVRNWYSYETRVPGTVDLHVADAQCSDIKFEHCSFYDGANAYAKRSMLLDKPIGKLAVTEDGLGIPTEHGYTRAAYRYANASVTLNNTNKFIHADATAGQVILTLPSAVDNEGKEFTIIKGDSTGNLVTVAPAGSDTLRDTRGLWTNGAPYNMAVQGYAVTIVASTGLWSVTGQIPAQSLRTTVAWNPGTVATGASAVSPAFTLAGVALGDQLIAGATASLQGCSATVYAAGTNQFQIVLTNLTGAPVVLGNISWNVKDMKWP
jgi:hypothetical protein